MIFSFLHLPDKMSEEQQQAHIETAKQLESDVLKKQATIPIWCGGKSCQLNNTIIHGSKMKVGERYDIKFWKDDKVVRLTCRRVQPDEEAVFVGFYEIPGHSFYDTEFVAIKVGTYDKFCHGF